MLSGTPAAGTGGSYPITITASNGMSPNATQSFTLTVNQAPANQAVVCRGQNSSGTPTFTVGTNYTSLPALLKIGVIATVMLSLLCGSVSFAAITQDSVATAAGNGLVSNLSWSHTVHAGSNVFLVVGLSYRVDNASGGPGAGTYASGVTADGAAMQCALAISDNNSGGCGGGRGPCGLVLDE